MTVSRIDCVQGSEISLNSRMPELKSASRDPDAICFGLVVKRLRMQRGWTLQQLGRTTGLHPNYLGVMERGGNCPSIQSLILISHTLGVHAAEVMKEIVDNREQFRKRDQPPPEEPAADDHAGPPPCLQRVCGSCYLASRDDS